MRIALPRFSLLLWVFLAPFSLKPLSAQTIWYVDGLNGNDANTGLSWSQAFRSVTQALAAASNPAEIWVRAGTYTPTADNDRSRSFNLKAGVHLYGGFAGTETNRNQRDWATNPTILSGEIGDTNSLLDNSRHVVRAASLTTAGVTLDGFTIHGGRADDPADGGVGGGVYSTATRPFTIQNCTFLFNSSTNFGGGIFSDATSRLFIVNCTFISNQSGYRGGGLYIGGALQGIHVLSNCFFAGNTCTNLNSNGGGAFLLNVTTMLVANCTFSNNFLPSNGSGGGAGLAISAPPIISNCAFIANTAANGGGLYTGSRGPIFTRCLFVNNVGTATGGGAVFGPGAQVTLLDCVFSNNVSPDGGGLQSSGGVIATNCLFVDNSTGLRGGGAFIYNHTSQTTMLDRCVFLRNTVTNSSGYGGGLALYNINYPTSTLSQCVFISNTVPNTGGYGAAIMVRSYHVNIQNCLFFTNGSALGGTLYIFGSPTPYTVVSNCTLAANYGGIRGGGLYIPSGYSPSPVVENSIFWGNTPPAIKNDGTGTITNRYSNIQGSGSSTNWNPAFGFNGGGNLDTDPLFANMTAGDLHLKSRGGRWTPSGWVFDALTSPCIDAGNPASDFSMEPPPNGNRINMGAYGNTPEASRHPSGRPGGSLLMIR